jgi:hypothetical protein
MLSRHSSHIIFNSVEWHMRWCQVPSSRLNKVDCYVVHTKPYAPFSSILIVPLVLHWANNTHLSHILIFQSSVVVLGDWWLIFIWYCEILCRRIINLICIFLCIWYGRLEWIGRANWPMKCPRGAEEILHIHPRSVAIMERHTIVYLWYDAHVDSL